MEDQKFDMQNLKRIDKAYTIFFIALAIVITIIYIIALRFGINLL